MRRGHLAATDVADYLAKRGLPFREAHAVVGHLVLMCRSAAAILRTCRLRCSRRQARSLSTILPRRSTSLNRCARTTEGGTAPAAVAVQLQRAEAQLVADEGVFGSLTKVVEMGHGAK
ncbi:MAG: hypothetical protein ACLTYW_11155 [Collinsella sp.]